MIEKTQMKLGEAQFFYRKMVRESERAMSEAFGYYLSAFVSAARSVGYRLQNEEKARYDAWYPGWEASLTDEERQRWKFMHKQRTEELKVKGAETELEWEDVPLFEPRQDRTHPAYVTTRTTALPGYLKETPGPRVLPGLHAKRVAQLPGMSLAEKKS
jgi:hypothetical protein